jgi:hypothetical protein
MIIKVKDPSTGVLLKLNAKAENFQGIHGFRIFHDNGSSFFIANKSGAWHCIDGHHINHQYLINIGLALEGKKLREQIVQHK